MLIGTLVFCVSRTEHRRKTCNRVPSLLQLNCSFACIKRVNIVEQETRRREREDTKHNQSRKKHFLNKNANGIFAKDNNTTTKEVARKRK
jgi:hypothetical protein